jgi:hypothetical protein
MKNKEILEAALQLSELLDEAVPEVPTYWNGKPEGYDFPMDDTAYSWLHSTLSTLIGVMEAAVLAEEEAELEACWTERV